MATKEISEQLLKEAQRAIHDPLTLGILPYEPRENGLYPKVDLGIWLRSCIKEVAVPMEGKVVGIIPSWITGDFLQVNTSIRKYF